MTFELDLKKFQVKTKGKVPRFMRMILIQAFKEIVFLTPVKTGRARANWFPKQGEPSREVTQETQTDPTRAFLIEVNGKDDLYISNSLPYIMPLERGSSTQAPSGMVRITRNRLKTEIESGKIQPT